MSYVKSSGLTRCGTIVPMKKLPKKADPAPVTSVRLDRDVAFRARQLALRNKRDGEPEATLAAILNVALAEYLKKRGA